MTALLTEGRASHHAFLDHCTAGLLNGVEQFSKEIVLPARSTVFHEGDYAHRFYLLLEGEAELVCEGETGPKTIMTLGPGDLLGCSWLFPPFRYQFTARTLTPCRALSVDGAALLIRAEEDPVIGYELMKRVTCQLIRRLESARQCLIQAARGEWDEVDTGWEGRSRIGNRHVKPQPISELGTER